MKKRDKGVQLNLFIALLLLTCGVLFNKWIIGYVFPAATFSGPGIGVFVFALQITFFLLSACVFVHRKSLRLVHYLFVFFAFMVFLSLLFLADLLLGLLGYPSLPQQRLANPPFFREVRKSIGEYEYEFVTNSQGLRYQEINFEKESPSERRIYVMGDSYVEGQGVEFPDTFTARLESKHESSVNLVRFINGGLQGTAPVTQMQALFHIGFKYNIDGVLICIFPNDVAGTNDSPDFEPSIKEISKPDGIAGVVHFFYPRLYSLGMTIKRNPPDLGRLLGKRDIVKIAARRARKRGISQQEIDDWQRRIPADLLEAANKFQFNGSALTAGLFRPDVWKTSLDIYNDSAKRKWNNLQKTLQFTYEQCQKRGIAVALIYIPTPYEYDPAFHDIPTPTVICGTKVKRTWLTETSVLQQNLAGWADQVQIPFLDLTPAFRRAVESTENIAYPLDTHWTPVGHRIAAEEIENWLIRENFMNLQGPIQ